MAFSKYNDVVEEQMSKGVIKKVERSELDGSGQYISHDAEITPLKSTTKLRVVCDASVKTCSEIRIGDISYQYNIDTSRIVPFLLVLCFSVTTLSVTDAASIYNPSKSNCSRHSCKRPTKQQR